MGSGSEPNSENKLFVGGCPPGSGEEELRQIFEKYGLVEEVFVMRGGSRSGMACAFIRFQAQDMAQSAIDAIHGQVTLPKSAEPLVVRWADAPGSRRRDFRERKGGRGGMGRDNNLPQQGYPYMPQQGFNYQQMPHAMHMHMNTMGGMPYGTQFYPQQMASMGWQAQHMPMMGYHPQQAMMMGSGMMDPRLPQQNFAGSADGLSIGVPLSEAGDASSHGASPMASPHLMPYSGYVQMPPVQLPGQY